MTEEIRCLQTSLSGEVEYHLDMEHSNDVGMEMPHLDIATVSPSIPRVKLPDIRCTSNGLSRTSPASDPDSVDVQSQKDTMGPAPTKIQEETNLEPSLDAFLPSKEASQEESHTAQRASTESSGSRSKTYSIAELVELGYRSRRISRDELRLSDEAPIEHIFPGGSTERIIADASSFLPRRRAHRRDLSTQSLSSASDREEFPSKPVHSLRQSESLLRPRRQPRNPPDGSLLQNNAGFAHFLKQHASPPHKRVTAGGRIVPAGPNSPPPTFKMETIDAMLQGNPRGTWPSRYSAPPPKLQDMFTAPYQPHQMHNGSIPNVDIYGKQNGVHGAHANAGHQRSQTATLPQLNPTTVHPTAGHVSGIPLPEGAEYMGDFGGIHVINLHGRMGQIEQINHGQHCVFKPLDMVKPFQASQQPFQQPSHLLHYHAPSQQALNRYPAQPFPTMLPTVPAQQYHNGFPGFPGFPGMCGSISTGFVPTGNNHATGFAPISNGQVRGTPSIHVPIENSPQLIQTQQHTLATQYEAYQKELNELERYAALHNDEFTPPQNIEIAKKRKTLVFRLDETRKQKLQLENNIQSGNKTAVPHSSKSRQSSKTRDTPQAPNIFEVVQTAIHKDEKQRELHKTTKKFSPDAPVFVPAASAGFGGSHQQLLEAPPVVTNEAARDDSPVVLGVDASYCGELGFNNPSEPKQFCTEPQEYAQVITAAHKQARRYGCEGGQSKNPEWDAEQDIRWAMQDELPIPLSSQAPKHAAEQPWNWADSYYNVRRYRTANWMPPRYIQEPKPLPPSRAERSRQKSVDGGVSLFSAQSVVAPIPSTHSSGRDSALTIVEHKSNQNSPPKGPQTKTGAMNDSFEGPSQTQVNATTNTKLSKMNLALLNSRDDSQIDRAPVSPLSRANSGGGSFVTNFSQEQRAKTAEQSQLDALRLRKKAKELMEQYAALQHNPVELFNDFEPLAELARRVELNVKGKERLLRNDDEQTDEILEHSFKLFDTSPNRPFDSSKTSPHRRAEAANTAAVSLMDKTNNELKTVPVAPELKAMTKSMTKRQAGYFARSLIGTQSPEQPEGHASSDKTVEAPKSDAQKRLLAHLNFANGDENLPFNSSSASLMYKARSSIASPTFEARGLVHSPGTSTEVQPPTPNVARNKERDAYTDHDLGLMRKASMAYTKEWANEGFRNPGNRLSHKKFQLTRASEETQEPKMTRAQRYQARHGLGLGHGTTEW